MMVTRSHRTNDCAVRHTEERAEKRELPGLIGTHCVATFLGQLGPSTGNPCPYNSIIKLHNPTREKNSHSEPAMIRRNSGERRPIGSNMSVDRSSPVPAPQAPLPPRRRRSSGASSRSSSSGVRTQQHHHQQALPPPPRRVAFKNETRVRIIHSWRDMSERQWRDTWVTVS